MTEKQRMLMDLGMKLAQSKRYLQFFADTMTETQLNSVLDLINNLTKIIEALESEESNT